VRLEYRSEAGSEWVAEVDPWAVVVRHGRWYLLCHSYAAGDIRAYRIDRVRGVDLLDDAFATPADLDPVGMLEEHLAVGWDYAVDVVIGAGLDAVARCVPRSLGRLEALDATTTRLVGSTSNPAWYTAQLATLPVPYRIEQSAEVRDAARLLGQRLLDASSAASPD
jgi:predicted DNA-binding transcriptional regulator YafY